ncbi:MAG: helix-turn-helix domain-containing protein [Gammaproteobacteria bacterium]|nr:helix-turn-helix domain-containing protein [Gammaproteobacteria bacterium]
MSDQQQGDLLASAGAGSPTPPAATPASSELSIGQTLARWRGQRGESIAQVAARLKCDKAVIEALEADRFNDLGAPVFARGHLKRYAELLGAPVEELLERWSVVQRQSLAPPDLTSLPRARARSVDTRVWGRRVGAAAVALVIGLAAWWILKGSGTATAPAQLAAQALPPPPPAPAPLPVAAEPASADPTMAEAPATAVPPAAAVAPATVAASAPPVVGDRAGLRLAAREDSWIQVVDGTGRRLYFGTLRGDNSVTLSGAAPLRVLLGRADVTAVEFAGRPVNIPSSMIFNATAHFTIDASGQVQRVVAPVQP